jgi:hypothetical protein
MLEARSPLGRTPAICCLVGGKFKSETELLSAITDTTILARSTLLVQRGDEIPAHILKN